MLRWFFLSLAIIVSCHAESELLSSSQLIVVTTPNWDTKKGTLLRFERTEANGPWQRVGSPFPVVLGKAGIAWGIGLHPTTLPEGPTKVEGDNKSPAGVFSFGTAFGLFPKSELQNLKSDYLFLTENIEAVDDPASTHYNCIVDRTTIPSPDWKSSEKMAEIPQYALGIVINHNFPAPKPGAGSSIFMHIWRNKKSGTAGCTALCASDLLALLQWIDPSKKPLLVQLPAPLYLQLEQEWNLPQIEEDKK